MSDGAGSETPTLSPGKAFGVLGNETRVRILQTLGESEEPLGFSELRKRVGSQDSGQFNYHLDKLTGHFVERVDAGYQLREAGRRVVMAVLSGAVTESPVVERTLTDVPCSRCGAPTEITYHDEYMWMYCSECEGHYTEPRKGGPARDVEPGFLGSLPLPPAAVHGRSAKAVALTAMTWGQSYLLVLSAGVCPECGSSVDRSVTVCKDHDVDGAICQNCNGYHPARIHMDCAHCIVKWDGRLDNGLLATTELQAFLLNHGLNLVLPDTNVWAEFEYEEEILSTEPFEARVTFTIDGDSLALTVDDELEVVEASARAPEST